MSTGISGVDYIKIVRLDSANAFYFKPREFARMKSCWDNFDVQTCPEEMLMASCDYAINLRLNTYTHHKSYRDLESVFDTALRIK
jgi:hypothetical protein